MSNHCWKSFCLLSGDFNCIMDVSLDKSSSANMSNPRSSTVLNNFCTDAGLVDVIRHLNPDVIDYAFYSHPHCFFVPKQFLHVVPACHLNHIVLLHHSSVYLHINPAFSIQGTPIWCFNTSLLSSVYLLRYHSFGLIIKVKVIITPNSKNEK